MSEPKFRSDLPVAAVPDGCCGSDQLFAHAAWVQPAGTLRGVECDEDYRRVIGAMVKNRHGSPFEKGLMTVYVEAPAVVWWEWTRHRFMSLDSEDFAFSLESGRYKVLDGEFYVPPDDRPVVEPAGFKPMRPVLGAGDTWDRNGVRQMLRMAAFTCWERYGYMVNSIGAAREVARLALPFSIYYAGYVSANPRTWLQFFSLRKADPAAKFATFPQWEIQQVCERCERLFADRWPLTHAAFCDSGRTAP